MRVHTELAVQEVREQKREVVEHVDARYLVAELDAVEQGGAAVEEADVPQMEVTMAATNEPLRHCAGQP